jgi:uncharacterized protein (TIGR03083 family)
LDQSPTLHPDDLPRSAATVRAALTPALGADWSVAAGDLEWDCRRTLDHIADSLAFYAIHLATRATTRKMPPRNGAPTRRPGEPSDVPELLDLVDGMAAVLAEVARAAPAGTRAFHPAGMADVEGFIAMGCEEILIHADDIAAGLGLPFAPPPALADRVVRRLFPWAPTDSDPWQALRWACGRTALPDRPRLGPDWWVHCAPLAEWDGAIKTRTSPPAWT